VTALSARTALAGVSALALAAVAVALFTQHQLGMLPCPWCVLQRLIFVVIGLAALPGALLNAPAAKWLSVISVLTLAASGIAAALWQHFVAASSASCNLTLADRIMNATGLNELWPQVFAPYASCADAAVRLAGLPYEFFSLALFGVLGLLAVWAAVQRPPRRGFFR